MERIGILLLIIPESLAVPQRFAINEIGLKTQCKNPKPPMSAMGHKRTTQTRGNRMKYFLLEGEHIVPFEKRAPELIAAHRQFLQQGYDAGRFLLSGPSIPPKGGILIARAQSLEELKEFLANEPYCKAKVMRFSKITEFNPVQHQAILNDWFGKSQS